MHNTCDNSNILIICYIRVVRYKAVYCKLLQGVSTVLDYYTIIMLQQLHITIIMSRTITMSSVITDMSSIISTIIMSSITMCSRGRGRGG